VEDAPLQAVLERLRQKARIDLIYTSRLVSGHRVTCKIEAQSPSALMRCVLRGTGLRYRRLSSGTFALKEETARKENASQTVLAGVVRTAAPGGEGVSGASVWAPAFAKGTTTDKAGFFRLALPTGAALADSARAEAASADTVAVFVSHVGYASARPLLAPRASADEEKECVTIRLHPTPVALPPVAVEAQPSADEERLSTARLRPAQVESVPPFLGETDPIDILRLLPGVQSEGAAGLSVRGSGPEQNLVLLDGAPVYNAYHALGFLSVFNPSVVRGPEFRTGRFPARYGGHLASVLSFRTREGDPASYDGSASLGLINGNVFAEGPLGAERGSFALGARRSFVGELAQPLLLGTDSPFRFWDLNAVAGYDLTPRDHLRLSLYAGRDDYRDRFEEDSGSGRASSADIGLEWGTQLATLRWDHAFSGSLSGSAVLFASDYDYRSLYRSETSREGIGQKSTRLNFVSGVRDAGLRADFDYAPASRHDARFGFALTRHRYRPSERDLRQSSTREGVIRDTALTPGAEPRTTEWALYAEDEVQLSSRLSANVGVRGSGLFTGESLYATLEPRLSVRYAPAEALAVEASYSRMAQYVHQLSTSALGLPIDLWVPATPRVGPARGHQVTTGLAHDFGGGFEGTLEGYYKWMTGLVEYEDPTGAPLSGSWEELVEAGRGRSYGVELLLEKHGGATTGWLSYTLSRSTRTFEGLNGGEPFPFRYDRRHDLTLTLAHQLTSYLELTGTWVYRTGNALTLPESSAPVPANTRPGGARNSDRLPAYERLDAGARFTFSGGGAGHQLYLGVYNAYDHANPFFVRLGEKLFEETPPEGRPYRTIRKIVTLPTVLPALRYTITF
jgi:hypothetical protein